MGICASCEYEEIDRSSFFTTQQLLINKICNDRYNLFYTIPKLSVKYEIQERDILFILYKTSNINTSYH
jgi:hypothetical protein